MLVALVAPLRCITTDRRMKPDAVETTLDATEVITLFEEREREAPRPTTLGAVGRLAELDARLLFVLEPECVGEPP